MRFVALVSVKVENEHYMGNKLIVESDYLKITGWYPMQIKLCDIIAVVPVNQIWQRDLVLKYVNGVRKQKVRLRFFSKKKRNQFLEQVIYKC